MAHQTAQPPHRSHPSWRQPGRLPELFRQDSQDQMKHTIPLGTHVTFQDDYSGIYVVDQYQEVLHCAPDCPLDHDCFEEPYINVRKEYWTVMPLSKLKLVFDQHSQGRVPTLAELT